MRPRWLPRSPTAQLLVGFLAVFALQTLTRPFLGASWVVLSGNVPSAPWTAVTNVYAHAGLGHLLGNAVALALIGFPLERTTTPARFHAFFLVTGVLSGLAEVLVGAVLGSSIGVLGASGAILALYGYVVAGNPVAASLRRRLGLSRRGELAAYAGLAVVVTLLTAGPVGAVWGVALIAHFTGFLLGLIAGRLRVLRVG